MLIDPVIDLAERDAKLVGELGLELKYVSEYWNGTGRSWGTGGRDMEQGESWRRKGCRLEREGEGQREGLGVGK